MASRLAVPLRRLPLEQLRAALALAEQEGTAVELTRLRALIDGQDLVLSLRPAPGNAGGETVQLHVELLDASATALHATNAGLAEDKRVLQLELDELARAHVDLQNLMDATNIATVFLDPGLRITRYTPAAAPLFGLQAGDLGRPLEGRAAAVTYPELAADLRQVLDHLQPAERELDQADGSGWLARVRPYRTPEGQVAGVVVSLLDISERRRAEQLRTWLSTVVASSTDGIISFGLDLRVKSWNPGAERIFGYSSQECVGQSLLMMGPGQEAQMRANLARLQEGESLRFETTRVRKDGSDVRVALTVAPIHDAAGRVIGGTSIARDVTEARRQQDALEAAMRALEEADAAKDRFLAVLSHELRNPLASIANAVGVMGAAGAGDHEREAGVAVVARQVQAMRQLMDDLLDVSRLRLGRLHLRTAPVTLREVVAMAQETVTPFVEARGHRLEVALPAGDVVLQADALRLAQLLSNLLGNACKYTPDRGRIRLSAQTGGGQVFVDVEDDGIGMDPAQLERMFELFVQGGTTAGRHRGWASVWRCRAASPNCMAARCTRIRAGRAWAAG